MKPFDFFGWLHLYGSYFSGSRAIRRCGLKYTLVLPHDLSSSTEIEPEVDWTNQGHDTR
ncbi:hypothetical protein [Metallosphaera sedula]|uniref:hypothetical protein n=1 Tax=Metallosphaera sedula TaxID=43687 RepID=UPI000ABBCB27|nr:hypothetical protein [Metallosphaera sedula]